MEFGELRGTHASSHSPSKSAVPTYSLFVLLQSRKRDAWTAKGQPAIPYQVFQLLLENHYFNFATRLKENIESGNEIKWRPSSPFLTTPKCQDCQEAFGRAFQI